MHDHQDRPGGEMPFERIAEQGVRDSERSRISRELHDVVGGMLTAMKFDLTRLSWGLEKVAGEAAGSCERETVANLRHDARQLIELTRQTLDAVRAISEGLRPGWCGRMPLQDGLRHEAVRFEQRYAIRTRFETCGEPFPLSPVASLGVFRIVQEALTNVARHAGATCVEIRLDWSASTLRVEVSDDGVGFRSAGVPGARHLGLLGMLERAADLGGRLHFGAGRRAGASVSLCVPVSNAGVVWTEVSG